MKKWFSELKPGNILIEVLSVVFAVLLALFLNEWRSEKLTQATFEEARTKIQNEIRENAEEIRTKQKYHKQQVVQLESIADSLLLSDKALYEYDNFGIAIINLKFAAWESVRMTEIVNEFSFDDLSRLAEIYKGFETMNGLQDNMIGIIYSMDFNDNNKRVEAYHSIRSYLFQIQIWEQEILADLDQFEL